MTQHCALGPCLVILLGASPTSATAQGKTDVTLESIAKAWSDRQARVKSARFLWTERETIPKGQLTDFARKLPRGSEDLRKMGIQEGAIVPPEDTTYDVACSLSFEGEKIRYVRDLRDWSAKENGYIIQPKTAVFDGRIGKTLRAGHESSWAPWPQGSIRRNHPLASHIELLPIIMTLRANLAPVRTIDLDTWRLTGRKATIHGNACLELEQQLGHFIRRIWVDPAREFVIFRFHSTQGEQTIDKIDVAYVKHPDAGWVPASWSFVSQRTGGKSSAQAKVTKCEINANLDPGEFDIEFPPGTVVLDSTDPKKQQDYIVRESSSKRIILPAEKRLTYQELVSTEPGESLAKTPQLSWTVWIAALVAILCGAVLIWRRSALARRRT